MINKPDLKNITILYVEDDDIARENMTEYLSVFCNNVIEARDGLDAFEKYSKNNPHIIITDIQMPKLSGLELARKIRKNDIKTQIIITTAYSNKEYLFEAVELQLVKYLVKPVKETELLKGLEKCLENIKKDVSNIRYITKDLIFDLYNKNLILDNSIIKLRQKELDLLELLCSNEKRYATYEEIQNYVWGEDYMSKSAIKTVIKDLKQKLPENTISNLSGIGYKINLV